MRAFRRLLLSAAIGATGALLRGQGLPFADEFQANTYTTSDQTYPAIGARGDTYVVVWKSNAVGSAGMYGQRFNSLGQRVGSEFPLAGSATSTAPGAVVVDGSGGFVVLWENSGQRFDSSGAAVGAPLSLAGRYPRAAGDAAGNFVVVTNDGYELVGRRFDSSGAQAGSDFVVSEAISTTLPDGSIVFDAPTVHDVARQSAGGFIAVWEVHEFVIPIGGRPEDQSALGIYGQRFDASGSKIGPQYNVEAFDNFAPSVAAHEAGDFLVVWQKDGVDGDGDGPGIFGQRFNSEGAKVGPEFQINSYTTGVQSEPFVRADEDGRFLVVWRSEGQDGNLAGVFGQRLDPFGRRIGGEFQINTFTILDQDAPQVASDGRGFVAVWQSQNEDGSGVGIFGRKQGFVARGLSVDLHGNSATNSDLDGVLEAGEAAMLETSWEVDRSLGVLGSTHMVGAFSEPAGPAGPSYTLPDGAADYGIDAGKIVLGGTRSCYDASGAEDCSAFAVAGARPSLHWDATVREDVSGGGGNPWTLHIGDSFSDIPRSQPFYRKIETLLHHGITSGCGGTQYCPAASVPRDQMAIFVAKALAGAGELVPESGRVSGQHYDCAEDGTSLFSDVPPGDPACRHVHYLAARNVTLGCGAGTYCPGQTITRDAMASFIAKAIVAAGGGGAVPSIYGPDPVTGLSYSCDAGSPSVHFTDVPVSSPFCKHVHYLWAKGIVGGCSPNQYCPTQTVARDAMAKFIANGFGLKLYGP
jgi:hypothetical protein